MSSPIIDYDSLAKQNGGAAAVDYDALAKQHGGAARNWLDEVADYAKGFGKTTADAVTGTAHALADVVGTGKAIARSWPQQNQELADRAEAAFNQGKYAEGARHVLSYVLNALPGFGAQVDEMGNQAGSGKPGALARSLGSATSVGLQMVAPELVKNVKAPITPRISNPNPAEAAALQYLEERGVPVSAGARTGNPFVKNVQKAADSTPLGAVVAQKAQTQTTNALRAEAGRLVEQAAPEISADAQYAAFRAAERAPENLQRIQTGTREVSTGVIGPNGQPIMRRQPVFEEIPLPVNVRRIKAQIKPIYDEISKWWEPAKRNASAGYQAMKSILDGPDHIPASQAEAGLSGLKALAREGDGRNAGIAKFIVPKLQADIDAAVSRGGDAAVNALRLGRKAAAAEIAAGRLQQIFEKAMAEGGFNREAGIWHDWQRARGDISKQLPPAQFVELEKFFLGAKKIAENPNPSGTALVSISSGSGALVFTHPTTGIPLVIGAGALSKLMHSTAGVRALTRGLKLPLNAPSAALAAGQILKIAGQELAPVQLPAAAENGPSSQSDLAALLPVPR